MTSYWGVRVCTVPVFHKLDFCLISFIFLFIGLVSSGPC